jgi:hypothetical protein
MQNHMRRPPMTQPLTGGAREPRHPVTALLFTVVVVMLFTLSGGVLWELGVNYSGITGAAASKIHPATYLTCFVFACLFLRTDPVAVAVRVAAANPGTMAFLAATVLLGAYIVLDERRGIATIFDTYLLAALSAIIVNELSQRERARIETVLHVLLAANAALAIVESVVDIRFFPFRFDGDAFEWDHRSTALLGHPLDNAMATGAYVLILAAGGGPSLAPALRAPMLVLQFAALVPIGGRTALIVTSALLLLWVLPRALRVLLGTRVSMSMLAAGLVLVPAVAVGAGLLAVGGFFDLISDRFENDGGSANARLGMLELFRLLPLRSILIGADPDLVAYIQRASGLEWGIENPLIRLVLYQGVAFTTMMVAGFVLFIRELARRLQGNTTLPFVFFLVVVNSYESISGKTLSFTHFVVLMLVMFEYRPQRAARQSTLP